MTSERIPCRVVGLSSLVLDGNEGTPREKHVIFCDLDGDQIYNDPQGFAMHVREVQRRWDVDRFFLFRTLKGHHLVSPNVFSRRETELIEREFLAWGADEFHGFMGYKNGEAIMRVTPKPGEVDGIQYVRSYTRSHPAGTPWSLSHWRFLAQLHPEMPRWTDNDTLSRWPESGEIRLHDYDTTAVVMLGDP